MSASSADSPTARDVLKDWLARRGLSAEFRETHASVVALTRDRVFKMKKPVRYSFVDLSTPQLRLNVCEREVRLNTRLAPDVYLGVVPITSETGVIVDHAVEMIRLPDANRLDSLLRADRAASCVDAVAARMAEFHAAAATSPQICQVASPGGVRALWDAEVAGISQYVGTVVDAESVAEIDALAHRYLAGRHELLESRLTSGRIRDGHGDLRADQVFCMPDGPRMIDCLEFDDELRWGDVLDDVGFLAMDLEWLGRPDVAQDFLSAYKRQSGDTWPKSLEHHWIGYRALVRAKVGCIRAEMGDAVARRHARGHLDLARSHLGEAQVRLILVGGLPGTGKTTLARELSAAADGPVLLRSDVVRNRIAGIPRAEESHGFGRGRYQAKFVDQVYEEMLRQAGHLLALGEDVVLDASWSSQRHRQAAMDLAGKASADLIALECHAPTDVAEARIRARSAADESEADVGVFRAMARLTDPWPEAERIATNADPRVGAERGLGAIDRAQRQYRYRPSTGRA
ncbi:MAG: AAA family ATPase [Candidatus Nanopelagicales bacterium]|nr:AAA family ATPase [Candidatus Nanopelagicales bacterium]MDZ4250480.1 AAA family ATPase [Candidatus Nanopelagicales bacterium]